MKTTGELQTSFNFGEGSSPAPVIPTKLDLIFEAGVQKIKRNIEGACHKLEKLKQVDDFNPSNDHPWTCIKYPTYRSKKGHWCCKPYSKKYGKCRLDLRIDHFGEYTLSICYAENDGYSIIKWILPDYGLESIKAAMKSSLITSYVIEGKK